MGLAAAGVFAVLAAGALGAPRIAMIVAALLVAVSPAAIVAAEAFVSQLRPERPSVPMVAGAGLFVALGALLAAAPCLAVQQGAVLGATQAANSVTLWLSAMSAAATIGAFALLAFGERGAEGEP
jgi:hypothetical protein